MLKLNPKFTWWYLGYLQWWIMLTQVLLFAYRASIGSEEKFIFVPSEWHYWRHCSRLDSATWLAFLIFHSSGRSRARGAPDVLRANPTVHPHELLRLRRYTLNKIGGKIVHKYALSHSDGRHRKACNLFDVHIRESTYQNIILAWSIHE